MEAAEISEHLWRVFAFLRNAKGWSTAKDIETGAGVRARTARLHAQRLSETGIVETAELWPAHRYRINAQAFKKGSSGYLARLEAAGKVFGSS